MVHKAKFFMTCSVPVFGTDRNIPAVPAGTERNLKPWFSHPCFFEILMCKPFPNVKAGDLEIWPSFIFVNLFKFKFLSVRFTLYIMSFIYRKYT